jgi:nucleoside-diphosphate-sugar epimerase
MGDYSSQRMGGKYPEQIVRATVDNAVKLRESLPFVRNRTIYFSSSMVYGNFETFAHEDQILNPVGHYGISRLAGEQIIKGAARDSDHDVVIVRPSAVFGPLDSDDRVIGQFALAALENRNLRVNGPKMILDFTPVHVVVNKVIALLHASNLSRRVYNVTMSDRSLRAMSLESAALSVVMSTTGSTSEIKKHDNESGWPTRGLLSRDLFEQDVGKIEYNPNLTESIFGACLWRKEFRERTGF